MRTVEERHGRNYKASARGRVLAPVDQIHGDERIIATVAVKCSKCRDRRHDGVAPTLALAELSVPPWLPDYPDDQHFEPRWWVLPIKRASQLSLTLRGASGREWHGIVPDASSEDGEPRRNQRAYYMKGVQTPSKGVQLECSACPYRPRKRVAEILTAARAAHAARRDFAWI